MKHGTLIKHDKMMCHAQESLLLLSNLWSYFPLIIFHTVSCRLYNLKTVRDISMKLISLIKQNDRICDAQELFFFVIYSLSSLPIIQYKMLYKYMKYIYYIA